MPPSTSVRAGRAHKVLLVLEVENRQCQPLPDEGKKVHKKIAAAVINIIMIHKWYQMHHEQHPYILPLDLKTIHPKIVK